MKWLALDIGGANLKAADGEGFAVSQPFPLWENPRQLTDALRALIALVPKADHVAVTMTGELADCFQTKAEGVLFILDALAVAADGRHTRLISPTASWFRCKSPRSSRCWRPPATGTRWPISPAAMCPKGPGCCWISARRPAI